MKDVTEYLLQEKKKKEPKSKTSTTATTKETKEEKQHVEPVVHVEEVKLNEAAFKKVRKMFLVMVLK